MKFLLNHLQYDCHAANLNRLNISLAWWTDIKGKTNTYWVGNETSYNENNNNNNGKMSICQCGYKRECHDEMKVCNCDSQNSLKWLRDDGFITDLSKLPVTQLNFGGVRNNQNGMAHFELGPLICKGEKKMERDDPPVPQDCQDLMLIGYMQVGSLTLPIR